MAGLSGRNTKIAPSKLGCRLPFENAEVGDGYTGTGPCLVRKMTPEEIAKYGPPKPRPEDNPVKARFMQAIKVSRSPEQAADLLGVTVGWLNQHLGFYGIRPRWGKLKEDETMPAIQMTEEEAREKLPPGILDNLVQTTIESPESGGIEVFDDNQKPYTPVQDPPASPGEGQEDKPKTRFEIIREKLTKKQYLALKGEGPSELSDREVLRRINLPSNWIDVLVRLKKGWEIAQPAQPQKPKVVKVEEPRAQSTSGLTIAQALQLRLELDEDINCITSIIDAGTIGEDLSERVYLMLNAQRGIHQAALDRINEAFEKTVLPL